MALPCGNTGFINASVPYLIGLSASPVIARLCHYTLPASLPDRPERTFEELRYSLEATQSNYPHKQCPRSAKFRRPNVQKVKYFQHRASTDNCVTVSCLLTTYIIAHPVPMLSCIKVHGVFFVPLRVNGNLTDTNNFNHGAHG